MIDLHTHTTCSDGKTDPIEVLRMAERNGLTHISITDHNTVDAYFKIGDYKQYFSGRLVPGIEPECIYRGRLIELLGFGIDINKMAKLLAGVYPTQLELSRVVLNRAYKKVKNDFKLSPDVLDTYDINVFTYGHYHLHADIRKYPENKKLLDEVSWDNATAFYRNYLGTQSSPYFVDESDLYPTTDKVVNLIKQAGGKVFIPHIFLYGEDSVPFLKGLVSEFDIDGVECYYPKHTKEQTQFLLKFCKDNNLLVSAGSDFHGKPGYPEDVGTNVSASVVGWLG